MRNHTHVPLDAFISKQLIKLTIVATGTVLGAIAVYDEPFFIWRYALSDLGALKTKYGADNIYSRYIMLVGFLLAAYLMARMSYHFFHASYLTYRNWKAVLTGLISTGFFIFLYPHDVNKGVHSFGAGLMVGGCYFFAGLLFIEIRAQITSWRFILNQFVLHVTVLSYAVAYIANMPFKQIPQKFCFLGIIYSLERLSMVGMKEFTLKDFFGYGRA